MDEKRETQLSDVGPEIRRAMRAFDKAEVATREAVDDVKETSRELREKTDEANSHLVATAGETVPVPTRPDGLRLPLAATLPA